MSTWPAVTADHDLGDMTTLTAEFGFRPFSEVFPPLRDKALADQPPLSALKPCCGEVLANEDCDCAELLAQLEQANRHPILFTRRAAA